MTVLIVKKSTFNSGTSNTNTWGLVKPILKIRLNNTSAPSASSKRTHCRDTLKANTEVRRYIYKTKKKQSLRKKNKNIYKEKIIFELWDMLAYINYIVDVFKLCCLSFKKGQ